MGAQGSRQTITELGFRPRPASGAFNQRELADRFAVTQSVISLIVHDGPGSVNSVTP